MRFPTRNLAFELMKEISFLIPIIFIIFVSLTTGSEVKLIDSKAPGELFPIDGLEITDYSEFVEFMNLISSANFLNFKEEAKELESFHNILSYIEIICEGGLRRKDEMFAVDWISALYTLAQEIYTESEESVSSIQETAGSVAIYNHENPGKSEFVLPPSFDISDCEDYHLYNEAINQFRPNFDFFSAIKCKMMKEGGHSDSHKEDEEDYEYYDSYPSTQYLSSQEVLQQYEYKEFEQRNVEYEEFEEKRRVSDDSDDESAITVRHKFDPKKGNRNRGIGKIVNRNTLNAAANTFLTSGEGNNEGSGTGGVLFESMITSSASAGLSEVLGPDAASLSAMGLNAAMSAGNFVGGVASLNPLENPALIEQLQQQIMTQVMGQLAANNPQMASLLQQEKDRLTEVLGTDADGLPQISREGMIQYLRTSALPKLINSAIKGKTGVDVLKSLAMALRVLNEGLGVFEVVLKVLISVTRKVRYYSLYASSIVADMAREDNMKPMIDLSVPLDHLPEVKAKKSVVRRVTKSFTKTFKKSSLRKTSTDPDENGDEDGPSSPFTLGIQGALSKARAHTAEFKEIPPKLLLSLIHTILTELEKRNGLLREALAGKQYKNLLKLQSAINEAVGTIYKAMLSFDEGAQEHLLKVPASTITEILICLIAPVEMQTLKLNSHITKVTEWIKPLMAILDEESQLRILDFLLTDPEAENLFQKSKSGKKVKLFNYNGF